MIVVPAGVMRMDEEGKTNFLDHETKGHPAAHQEPQGGRSPFTPDMRALIEILRSNADPKARSDAATYLLSLVDRNERIDGDALKELFRVETDMEVATALKRVINKLHIKEVLQDDPTETYDRRLSQIEESRLIREMERLKRVYDKARKEGGSFDRKYRILREIEQGGMARIYEGVRLEDNMPIALKFLLLEELTLHTDPERLVARFRREGELLTKKLSHPNVLKAYEYGETDGEYFIVLEYLRGGTLDRMIRGGALTVPTFARVASQLLDAVEYIHRNDVIHRDIKPGNILVSAAQEVSIKLADFGLAKDKYNRKLSRIFFQAGTDLYSSPQQLKDARDADERDDIFSLGKTFYEMLTGNTFTNDEVYRPITLADESLSMRLNAVTRKCISPERKDRYQNIGELRRDLLAALDK